VTFSLALEKYTPAQIAEKLGCPERIVYAWKRGERQPRPWVQRLILKELNARKRR